MSTTPTRATASVSVSPTAAKAPAASPATVVTGVLLALVLLGVGLVFLRDALLAAGALIGWSGIGLP